MVLNGTTNYLRNNAGTLQVSTTATTWYNENNFLYSLYNNQKYYLIYDTSWKLLQPGLTYYIVRNGNYLKLGNDGSIQTSGTTSKSDATVFTLSSSLTDNWTGTISSNGYYLQINGTTFNTTTSTETNTSISYDGHGFYRTSGTTKYYIQYENSWKTAVTNKKTGYYFKSNNYYLGVSGTSIARESSANTIWYVDDEDYLYTLISGTRYYIYYNNSSTPALTNDYQNQNKVYLYTYYGETYLIDEGSDYYLYYRNYSSRWYFGSSSNTVTSEATQIDDYENTPIGFAHASNINSLTLTSTTSICSLIQPQFTTRISSETYTYTRSSSVSKPSVFNYIPLNCDSSNNVKDSNTGYIMSGGHSGASGNLTGVDIRVAGEASSYNTTDRLNKSYNTGEHKITDVYTYDDAGLHVIDESDNDYKKYVASKKSMQTTLSQHESAIGGIHFITSEISMSHIVNAPSTKINGLNYTNYEMPENAIDFNLAKQGYINFFATLYYPGSTTFFSLYKITRSTNSDRTKSTITEINHIVAIYKHKTDQTAAFIYKYESANSAGFLYSNNSNTISSDYAKVFDISWIETPTFRNGTGSNGDFDGKNNSSNYANSGYWMAKLFYFEIPVNEGEYCLGSVNGRDGGYLLYLDIGANAAPVDRTIITQKTQITQESLVYANGIQILETGNRFSNDSDSGVAVIKTSDTGTISISRTDDTIVFTSTNTLDSTYMGIGITLNGASLKVPKTILHKRYLYYLDYDRSLDRLFCTTVYNEGLYDFDNETETGSNIRYDCYQIDTSNGGKTPVTITGTDADDWGLLVNDDGVGKSAVFANFQNLLSINYGTNAILDYYSYISTASANNLTEAFDINIVHDSSVTLTDDDYLYEHLYHISGNSIVMTPDDLIVNIGPTFVDADISLDAENHIATVETDDYEFTFNSDAINNTKKTVTIYYVVDN